MELRVHSSTVTPFPVPQQQPEWRPMLPPDLFTPDIGADGIAVYGALCLYVDRQSGTCFPSHAAVAKKIGLTRKRVIAAIKRLKKEGFVEITHQDDRGMKRSNLYTLPHQKSANVQMSHIDTAMSRIGTADVPPRDSRCTAEGHKPYTSEPDIKEPDVTPVVPIKKSSRQEPPSDFLDFLNAYPPHRRYSGQSEAINLWTELNPDLDFRRVIMGALANHKASEDWKKEGGRYVPGIAKWLEQEKWQLVLDPAAKDV